MQQQLDEHNLADSTRCIYIQTARGCMSGSYHGKQDSVRIDSSSTRVSSSTCELSNSGEEAAKLRNKALLSYAPSIFSA